MDNYDHKVIEPKWRSYWRKEKLFNPNLDNVARPFYNLMMFPYPSAEGLHVGNMYAFTGSDIYGRMKRMQGKDVFEPIGLDGFGIHSENYAIKVNRNPKEQAKISQKNFYRQLEATGNAYDWERTLETYSEDYYKWTQWIFIQLFKKGLAYRKKSPVNYCHSCKTVLADEQVVQKRKVDSPNSQPKQDHLRGEISVSQVHLGGGGEEEEQEREDLSVRKKVGVCESCGTVVEKKDLEQWFFRITDYADRLLDGLSWIDWTGHVKTAQRNWIGKKEGIVIKYPVSTVAKGEQIPNIPYQIEVFTTRPDTNFGATFLVLAPEHPQALELTKAEHKKDVEKYIKVSQSKTNEERINEGPAKTGAFTGSYAINTLNGEKLPIWVSDFVLMDFGTGAVVGVPGHDKRDFEFAKKFNLPIRKVIVLDKTQGVATKTPRRWNPIGTSGFEGAYEGAYEGEGRIINSREWNGWRVPRDIGKVINWLEKGDFGRRKTTYHLRDWLISRQRYWGPPIPIIYCVNCWKVKSEKLKVKSVEGVDYALIEGKTHAIIPVPEKDLPVKLPDVHDWRPKGTGKSPLAAVESFVKTKCPNCGSKAERETDVSDTFLDSAWYFLRYLSTDENKRAWRAERAEKWLPVDMYIGGAEHSVLHLLYTRFLTMAFKDLGLISFKEPFLKFRAHGLLISKGAKMSKSKGNIVNPDDYIEKYGADALRMYLMFCGKFTQGGDFSDEGIEGMNRFLRRVWRLVQKNLKFKIKNLKLSEEAERLMHQTIKQVTEDIENLNYNTAISALMIWLNALERKAVDSKKKITVNREPISAASFTVPDISKERRRRPADKPMSELEIFLELLAPFAPFMTEELWQEILSKKQNIEGVTKSKKFESIHFEDWPKYEESLTLADDIQLVVQVNGKVRDTLAANRGLTSKEAEKLALASKKVENHIGGQKYRAIFVKDKIINFVI